MLKEARIILPTHDNDGQDLRATHDVLKSRLCEEFGGCTASPIMGNWIDPPSERLYAEAGVAYDVAADTNGNSCEVLHAIAFMAGVAAKQVCVYFREPSGKVTFVDTQVDILEAATH